ncbi:hypothetical protein FTO68_06215 [Methanocalculus taiwanensis]|uniref:Uncharacterized protein n=1 Tax=Methanocalculus taiwanensis TaxID=106207 RepID=A0ABD4TI13_9EURY|nr:hypothetical protein [Methanocalculus taiwanensis]MCQ1538579.1 hypothetical protein [Methanocalculus taiwanensis]
MPLDFKSQAEVVAYLREASEDCRGLSVSCRARGSILDAHYLAGRADAFSLASALIEALPSFKGEKTGASAPSPEGGKTKRGGGRPKRDPAADGRIVCAAEWTNGFKNDNLNGYCIEVLTGDPDEE